MASNYLPLLIDIVIGMVIACAMGAISFLLGPRKPTVYKGTTYECGMTPIGSAREKFPVKFYLVAMLFILFDVETIFLYPWAVTFHNQALASKAFLFGEMAVFVLILFVGYFYILGKGALNWDESEKAPQINDLKISGILAPRGAIRFGNEASGTVDLSLTPDHHRLPGYGACSQEETQSHLPTYRKESVRISS